MSPHYDPPSASSAQVEQLARRLESLGRVTLQQPVSKFTTFRVGGPAALFFEPSSEESFVQACLEAVSMEVPLMIMGRGSNVLVSDEGFPGLMIRGGRALDWISGEGARVAAGAFASLPQVANWAARRGLAGLEFSVAVPASVGGAVRMNAGAHGGSVADVLEAVRVLDLNKREVGERSRGSLEMSYRHTNLTFSDVVLSATFVLERAPKEEIASKMERYRQHRTETQPADAPNAGSMFKNPEGDSAGRLIEAAGFKGSSSGRASVSEKHANFFLAREGTTAQDVYDLMAMVQRGVSEKFDVLLIPEVRLIGRFDTSSDLKE